MIPKEYIGFFFLWLSAISMAQIPPILRNDTLQAVEINKQSHAIPPSVTVSAQQLSGSTLEKINSLSVADALKYFSGVKIRDYGGIGGMKTIDVRSLGTNHTAVFYNGIAINDAQSGQVDLGKFSLDNVQSISLYQNQHVNIDQPAKAFASASVLYLETKEPIFKEDRRTNVHGSFRGGSFGLVNPSLHLQQKISRNTQLNLNTGWMKADGEYDFHYKNAMSRDTLIRRKNTDIETFRIETSLSGRLADTSFWHIDGYAFFSERGLPGAAVNNNFYSEDRQWDRNLFLQGRWRKNISKVYSLKVNGKYTYNRLRYLDPTYSNIAGKLDNKYVQDELYLSAVNVFTLTDKLKTALSADYLYNTLDANIPQFAYPERNTGLVNFAADFKNDSWRVQGNILGTLVNEEVEAGKSSGTKTAFSPSLSVSWKPLKSPYLYLRTSYKSIFRMPTFNDSYYTFVGSTSLKPEYVQEFNVGFTVQRAFDGPIRSLSLTADGYQNHLKDRITAIPKNFRWTMINTGKVEITGLDIGMKTEVEALRQINALLFINYTWQKALDKTPGSQYKGQFIPYAPKHSASASGTFQYRSWGLNYNLLYTGSRYSFLANTPQNYMEDWFTQDLSLSYMLDLKAYEIKIMGEANNIGNADYTIIRNFPMPGRNYRFSIYFNY